MPKTSRFTCPGRLACSGRLDGTRWHSNREAKWPPRQACCLLSDRDPVAAASTWPLLPKLKLEHVDVASNPLILCQALPLRSGLPVILPSPNKFHHLRMLQFQSLVNGMVALLLSNFASMVM